jgi:hypothetical protein
MLTNEMIKGLFKDNFYRKFSHKMLMGSSGETKDDIKILHNWMVVFFSHVKGIG